MDEQRVNMSVRKFLKEVGVTSQRELEKVIREIDGQTQKRVKVKMVLTAEGTDLNHVVDGEIDLGSG
jgi:metal-sulfur cluster biosynthetic enzyme